jgi:hypothetical protein
MIQLRRHLTFFIFTACLLLSSVSFASSVFVVGSGDSEFEGFSHGEGNFTLAARGADPVKRRVTLRKGTRQQIEANQPRSAAGEMIDPNTQQPLKPGEIDVGHKPGQEWRKRQQMHRERACVIG